MVNIKKFKCDLCDKEIEINFLGDMENFNKDPKLLEELIDKGKHYHWIYNHRRCAICGKLIESEDLDLIKNQHGIRISENYIKETLPKESNGELLIIHKKCFKNRSK